MESVFFFRTILGMKMAARKGKSLPEATNTVGSKSKERGLIDEQLRCKLESVFWGHLYIL